MVNIMPISWVLVRKVRSSWSKLSCYYKAGYT